MIGVDYGNTNHKISFYMDQRVNMVTNPDGSTFNSNTIYISHEGYPIINYEKE